MELKIVIKAFGLFANVTMDVILEMIPQKMAVAVKDGYVKKDVNYIQLEPPLQIWQFVIK